MNLRADVKLSVYAAAADINGSTGRQIVPCVLSTDGTKRVATAATTITKNTNYFIVEKENLFATGDPDFPREIAADDKLVAAIKGEVEVYQASHGFSVGDELEWDIANKGFFPFADATSGSAGYYAGYVSAVIDANNFVIAFNGENAYDKLKTA